MAFPRPSTAVHGLPWPSMAFHGLLSHLLSRLLSRLLSHLLSRLLSRLLSHLLSHLLSRLLSHLLSRLLSPRPPYKVLRHTAEERAASASRLAALGSTLSSAIDMSTKQQVLEPACPPHHAAMPSSLPLARHVAGARARKAARLICRVPHSGACISSAARVRARPLSPSLTLSHPLSPSNAF